MEELLNSQGPGGALAVAVLTLVFTGALVLVALWIALPIALLGLRSAVREVAAAQRAANDELAGIRRALERLQPRRGPAAAPEPPSGQTG